MNKPTETIFDNGIHVIYKKTVPCGYIFYSVFAKHSALFFGEFRSEAEARQRAGAHSLDNYYGFETN